MPRHSFQNKVFWIRGFLDKQSKGLDCLSIFGSFLSGTSQERLKNFFIKTQKRGVIV